MSHLRDYDPDIFISYAHVDGVPLAADQPGWATSLHRALETKLAQLGVRANIFFDRTKLAGNDYFGPELEERLERTAVFVSIVSPGYVNSFWCLRELEVFCAAAERSGGLRRGNKARIFKVHKLPLEADRTPAPLAREETAGYQFYEVDPETGVPLEIQIREDQRLAMIRITQLARDVEKTLRELDASVAASAREAPKQPPGSAVYLARTSYDLGDVYEQVRNELGQRGAAVLPDTSLPQGPDFRRVVAAQLAQAACSVHLVGANYGMVPEGEEQSIVALQLAVAAERARAGGFSRFVWMPPGLTPKDERQQRLIADLRAGSDAFAGVELFETPLEELKSALGNVVRPAPAAARAPAPARGDAPLVYLICDPQDRAATAPLREHLFAQGCEVTLPLLEGSEADRLTDHRDHLRDCDAALIYCGQAGERWWREQLSELRKAPGYGRAAPMRVRAFYFGPPASPAKAEFLTQEALVMRHPEAFAPEALAPFLARLRTPATP